MPPLTYSYDQTAVVRCTGQLTIPDEVVAEGLDAIREFFDENEMRARFCDNEVINFGDRHHDTLDIKIVHD